MKLFPVYVRHPTDSHYLVIENCYSNMSISEFLEQLSTKIDCDTSCLIISFGGKCVEVASRNPYEINDIENTLSTYHIMNESTVQTSHQLC